MPRDVVVVPGRPAADGLLWWVLVPVGAAPQFQLTGAPPGHPLATHALRRPTDPPGPGDAYVVAATGLAPDRRYTLTVRIPTMAAAVPSRTLPRSLSVLDPFTIALGSCYCVAKDQTEVRRAYPPRMHAHDGPDPVRLRFLCGDQLYMDLSDKSGSPHVFKAPEPWEKYGEQWRGDLFAPFLAASPSVCAADDHEYWNDYPYHAGWLPWSYGGPGSAIGRTLSRTFELFQAALNLRPADVAAGAANPAAIDALLADPGRSFEIPAPVVPFFVLDTRSQRTKALCATPAAFQRAVTWIGALRGPGVLVLAQPLVAKVPGFFGRALRGAGFGDHGLPDYTQQYADLWETCFRAPHDVLIMAGDIHWSRLYRVERSGAAPSRRVFELVSSPLARIPNPPAPIGWFSGSPKLPKDRQGKVKWSGGAGVWTRAPDVAWRPDGYATVERQSFATASFVRRADGSVDTTARAWGADPSGQAVLLAEGHFTLR